MAARRAPPAPTPVGDEARENLRKYAREQDQCKTFVKHALEHSPMLNFLLREMEKRGCHLPAGFVRCIPAPDAPVLGGFHVESKRLFLNSAGIDSQNAATRTLVHELVHAFDHCRVRMDYSSCRHLACTEIRAAHLSEDCSVSAEWGRMNFSLSGQMKRCVRRRAVASIEKHPACAEKDAGKVVGSVFRRCFKDTAPFPGEPV